MSEIKTPRLLKAGEINARVQSVQKNRQTGQVGAVVLLYKDARTDMDLLDETFGTMNWTRRHVSIDGKLFCTIEVYNPETRGWVTKQDVGVESNMDATKGEASDAFKRAGFNWGIGRELYTAPFIYIILNDDEWWDDRGKLKARPSFSLSVKEIGYNEKREITRLVLTDRRKTVRYKMGQTVEDEPVDSGLELVPADTEPAKITVNCGEAELKKRGAAIDALIAEFDMRRDDYTDVAKATKAINPRNMTSQEFDEHLATVRKRFEAAQ